MGVLDSRLQGIPQRYCAMGFKQTRPAVNYARNRDRMRTDALNLRYALIGKPGSRRTGGRFTRTIKADKTTVMRLIETKHIAADAG